MKKKTNNKVSLGDIAKVAGVSSMAVSRALLNKPGVSNATRERIQGIAQKMGYAPDARLSTLMAQVRKTTSRELLPIAWLNSCEEKDAWQVPLYHTPYIQGARARALELGYKIEDIWAHEPGMTMKRLSRILYQRGIEGVVVTLPARHFRLDWDHLASVSLGASLLAPRLHRVAADLNFNLQLALKSVRRLGYRRIGICLWPQFDRASNNTIRAMVRDLYFSASGAEQIPALFYTDDKFESKGQMQARETAEWLNRYKPEVIVGQDGRMKQWAEEAGYRVPQDVGVVNLAVDDDVLDWAGIQSRRRETGATAVEQLVSLMRNRQFGVPKVPLNIMIRGTWQNGKTLRVLQPWRTRKKTHTA